MPILDHQHASRERIYSKAQYCSMIVFPILVALCIGFIWGAMYSGPFRDVSQLTKSRHQYTEPRLRTVSVPFDYNVTFSQPPSHETNHAWKDLFPSQAGYFRHPDLAPHRSTFSAFHQLHCVDGIRHGYWALYDAVTLHKAVSLDDLPMMAAPVHVRHCIELLRRSIMCQPDLTVEVKDDKVGGVRGFGTTHKCKDWEQLKQWTSQWETWGRTDSDGKGLVKGG